jgi:hypothetical protein
MTTQTVAPCSAVDQLSAVLDSPEIAGLIAEIEALRWTGRPGYGVRAMVGMMLAKSLYALPTWSRTARLVAEHPALQAVIGCAPSQWAAYRFCRTLREHSELLADCLNATLDSLRECLPEMGRHVAIDGSDLPAYANGQRRKSKHGPERKPDEYSDPDATWGHRSAVSTRKGGGYYGYKIHAAVDVATELPLAWSTETASASEQTLALPLLDAVGERGFNVKHAIMDGGYDTEPIHCGCMERDIIPITPLRETQGVKKGWHKPPLRARRVALRGSGLQAQGDEVALPDRRVQARVRVGQGVAPAPARAARVRAVTEALQLARRGRARVRKAQARLGDGSAPHPAYRAGAAARRSIYLPRK